MLTEPARRHIRHQIDSCRLIGGMTLKTIHDHLYEEFNRRRAQLPRPIQEGVPRMEAPIENLMAGTLEQEQATGEEASASAIPFEPQVNVYQIKV